MAVKQPPFWDVFTIAVVVISVACGLGFYFFAL